MEDSITEIDSVLARLQLVRVEIAKAVVGQREVIDQLLVAILAGGHCLLQGVPGLGKTLIVKAVSEALSVSFKRIQFTPDLMPGDVIGNEILEEDPASGKRSFVFHKGPIFAQIVLADEINRTPPKTQSALLEAMQERTVTYAGLKHELPEPFFILATQNPIEQAGTYALPEAQLDRFLFLIFIGYPEAEEELNILYHTTGTHKQDIKPVLDGSDIIFLQSLVRQVAISPNLIASINSLVRDTRPEAGSSDKPSSKLSWGAGPRGGQAVVLAAKALALLRGRLSVIPQDIRKVVHPALRHRLVLNFRSAAAGLTVDDILDELLKLHGF